MGETRTFEFTEDWQKWKIGDLITWHELKLTGPYYPLTRINRYTGWVAWERPGGEDKTLWWNVVKVVVH